MNAQTQLMDQLASPENLLAAWRAVRGNIPVYRRQRSSGPDGITLAEFERDLPAQLQALRHMLLKGRYQPQPPGLFSIEKRSGGTRQIAVLNIADRVTQRAAQQVLEPVYEPLFLPCSFGFRPGRSLQDAVYCARRLREHGYAWVVDGDIASCFDSLDHHFLLQRMNKRINDTRVIDLLQKWLGVGILQHGLPADRPNILSQSLKKASHDIRQGVNWTLNTLTRQHTESPYADARYEYAAYRDVPVVDLDSELDDENEAGQDAGTVFQDYPRDVLDRQDLQKRAVQQIAAGGLFLGSGWLRRNFAKAAPAALAALKTPAGQEILKRGLLIGGGTLGAAAGVALTSYMLYHQFASPCVGVLQGSPLSPLLSNIYLHAFDISITRAGYRLVRYADDWVILCPDEKAAQTAYNQSVIALNHIHLKVNQEKTHILSPADPLEWLGEVIG